MMQIKTKKQFGFTLIELLVVIAIMMIFTIISLPSYGAYTRSLAVKGSATDLRSLLWEAQALSLGPKSDLATSYLVKVGTTIVPPAPFLLEQVPANANITSSAVFNKFVTIEKIDLDGTDQLAKTITVSFDTGITSGKGKDMGSIRFFDGATELTTKNKLTIFLKSSASTSRYQIVINRALGSIVVSSI